jgi:hypothetical protein
MEAIFTNILEQRGQLASIISSYAFTSIGFILAATTLLYSLNDHSYFKQFFNSQKYKYRFFYSLFIFVSSLVLCFISSIISLIDKEVIYIALVSTIISIPSGMTLAYYLYSLLKYTSKSEKRMTQTESDIGIIKNQLELIVLNLNKKNKSIAEAKAKS